MSALFIKRFIGQFLQPFPIVFWLLVIGVALTYLCAKNRMWGTIGRLMMTLSLILFLAFGGGACNAPLRTLERTYSSPENFSALTGATVVVLGTGCTGNSSLPARFRYSTVFQSRLAEGVRIAKKIPQSYLVISLSGDCEPLGKTIILNEIREAYDLNEASCTMIPNAGDTREEATAAMAIAKGRTNFGAPKVVVVSSASHLPRAMKIFQESKIAAEIVAAPAQYYVAADSPTFKLSHNPLFSSENWVNAAVFMHEGAGLLFESATGSRERETK